MTRVIFWEKPGCKGNRKQKDILEASGHTLDVRNLLTEPWTEEHLRSFFGQRPVAEWFNISHPRIKAGEVKPDEFDEAGALALMVREPLFIVRPLIQVGEMRLAGFAVEEVDEKIGLQREAIGERDPKNCPCVSG